MRITNDYFMISVDQKYESKKTKSGIITLNTAYQRDDDDSRYANKRIYGRIESCPMYFTDTVLELVDPGWPMPRKYLGADYLQNQINRGYKNYTRDYYNCSTFEDFEKITVRSIAETCDIQLHDKVYFMTGVTEPANQIGEFQGKALYRIRADEVICVVRAGKIIPQGKWCLVEPDMETWDEILQPIPEAIDGVVLTNPDGSIRMKPKSQWLQIKVQPESKPLFGFIRSPKMQGLTDGDRILYSIMGTLGGRELVVKIEDKQYYVIDERDILCKVESSVAA